MLMRLGHLITCFLLATPPAKLSVYADVLTYAPHFGLARILAHKGLGDAMATELALFILCYLQVVAVQALARRALTARRSVHPSTTS